VASHPFEPWEIGYHKGCLPVNQVRSRASYQLCCTAMAWKATAAAVRLLPGLEELWNHPDFLAYVDRWVTRGAHT